MQFTENNNNKEKMFGSCNVINRIIGWFRFYEIKQEEYNRRNGKSEGTVLLNSPPSYELGGFLALQSRGQ